LSGGFCTIAFPTPIEGRKSHRSARLSASRRCARRTGHQPVHSDCTGSAVQCRGQQCTAAVTPTTNGTKNAGGGGSRLTSQSAGVSARGTLGALTRRSETRHAAPTASVTSHTDRRAGAVFALSARNILRTAEITEGSERAWDLIPIDAVESGRARSTSERLACVACCDALRPIRTGSA
jgi:hypothetical protein